MPKSDKDFEDDDKKKEEKQPKVIKRNLVDHESNELIHMIHMSCSHVLGKFSEF